MKGVGNGKRQHFVDKCDRHACDEAWEMLADADKDAFLEQQSERIDEKKIARKGEEEPRFVRDFVCQEPTPGFMGEDDVQIRKRKKLTDQVRSMSDVWKRIECTDFGGETLGPE